jgi:hypothetical protein
MLHEVIDRLHQLSNQQSLFLVELYDNDWDDKENGIEMVLVYDAMQTDNASFHNEGNHLPGIVKNMRFRIMVTCKC